MVNINNTLQEVKSIVNELRWNLVETKEISDENLPEEVADDENS